MLRTRKRDEEPGQLSLLLPNRQALRGLPTAARAELLDVMAQLLLQAQHREGPSPELTERGRDDG